MKLYIAENIRNYRQKMNLTQEQLAKELGVTMQAVSKWERDEGYPDILTLPILANFFHITIDELMGQNELTREKDRAWLWKGFLTDENFFNLEKEFLFKAEEYLHKHPDDWEITIDVCHRIIWDFKGEERENYLPLLTTLCRRIIKHCPDNLKRQEAIEAMVICAPEESLSEWTRLAPAHYEGIVSELLEKRLEMNPARRTAHFINRLALMRQFIIRSRGPLAWENGGDLCYLGNIALIESFGENGEIPSGWLALYAMLLQGHAHALIESGNTEEGLAVLEQAIEPSKAAKEVYTEGALLSFGREEFFGGLQVRLQRVDRSYPNLLPVWEGTDSDVYETGCQNWHFMPFQKPISVTLRRSKKLAAMREGEDPRFLAVMEKALACGV